MLGTGTFDHYTTDALLHTDILDHAVLPHHLTVLSTRSKIWQTSAEFCYPVWLPLVARYLAHYMITGKTHTTDEARKVTYLLRLAQHLCDLRVGPTNTGPADDVHAYLEHVAALDILKADWEKRTHLLDAVDDGAWNFEDFRGDLLDAAIWLQDIEMTRQLLGEEKQDSGDSALHDSKLSIRLRLAAERGNVEIIRLLHLNAGGNSRGLSSEVAVSLLARACQARNAKLFQYTLDEHDENDSWIPHVDSLKSIAQYCPSADSYRQVYKILDESYSIIAREYDHATTRPRFPFKPIPLFVQTNIQGTRWRTSHAGGCGHPTLIDYFVHTDALLDDRTGFWGQSKSGPPVLDRAEIMSLALAGAVSAGSLDVVQFLLDSGADPNDRLYLNRAIRKGHRRIAKLLVDYGADVNLGSPPPLATAALQEDVDLLHYLLEKGAVLEDEGHHPGALAMGLAQLFGLDSMAAELGRMGIAENPRVHWVRSIQEESEYLFNTMPPL